MSQQLKLTSKRTFNQDMSAQRILGDISNKMPRIIIDEQKPNIQIPDHNIDQEGTQSQVTSYRTPISHLKYSFELEFKPSLYMNDQRETYATMRPRLIAYLLQAHMTLKLVAEILYLSINIVDRHCSAKDVEKKQLFLIGLTALRIACKYEENCSPKIIWFINITGNAYKPQEFNALEQIILEKLEVGPHFPTAYSCLNQLLYNNNASAALYAAANYYLEQTLQEYELSHVRLSLLACALVYLAYQHPRVLLEQECRNQSENLDHILNNSTYTKEEIFSTVLKVAKAIGGGIKTASQHILFVAMKKKYGAHPYFDISSDVLEEICSKIHVKHANVRRTEDYY